MKLIVNQAYDNMGLQSTQYLGTILDGIMRNTPEGRQFVRTAEQQGVARRDHRARRALRRLQPSPGRQKTPPPKPPGLTGPPAMRLLTESPPRQIPKSNP